MVYVKNVRSVLSTLFFSFPLRSTRIDEESVRFVNVDNFDHRENEACNSCT